MTQKIAYVANIRFPTEKAHGYQIARVCSALVEEGAHVSLFVPTRRNHIEQSWHEYYGIGSTFRVVSVPCFDGMSGYVFIDRIMFVVQMLIFGIRTVRLIPEGVTVVTRDAVLAWIFGICKRKVVYNAHKAQQGFLHRMLLSRISGVVANSEGTEEGLQKMIKVPVVVIHNGSDRNPYFATSSEKLRTDLELPHDAYIALYSGHLYSHKGADTLIAAAEHLKKNSTVSIVVIGGLSSDVKKYQDRAATRQLTNIVFYGHQSKERVPKYLRAADVLLLPNLREGESISMTSPLKLFEYLSAGRPIIASDLPSMRAIISEETAFLVPPGDGAALAEAIEYTLEHKNVARSRADNALTLSERYTWEAHAQKFVQFLLKL